MMTTTTTTTTTSVQTSRLLRWFIGTLAVVSWLGYWQVNTRVLLQASNTDCYCGEQQRQEEYDHGEITDTMKTASLPLLKKQQRQQVQATAATTTATKDLPFWLQEYATWHAQAKSQLTPDNWQSQRFLVMTAIRGRRTGGLTDRLKPLPFFLKVAAQTNRILLIYWSKPFALEHYLVPPEGGLDWRVPPYMKEALQTAKLEGRVKGIVKLSNDTSPTHIKLLATQMQAHDYGESWYDDNPLEGDDLGGNSRLTQFRHFWHWAFTPTPLIAQRIRDEFRYMGLVPGQYASAHIRAVYAVQERSENEIIRMTKHAMDCVSMLRPGGPFFVASDTGMAITVAKTYGKMKNVTVVASSNHPGLMMNNVKDPLHLDMYNTTDPSIVPEDFYDAFVDLYLLGSTRCVAHGQGSFGHWGYLLGYDSSCEIKHFKGPSCKWTNPSSMITTGATTTDTSHQQLPMFRRPMAYDAIYAS